MENLPSLTPVLRVLSGISSTGAVNGPSTAFSNVVTSSVDDIINPLTALKISVNGIVGNPLTALTISANNIKSPLTALPIPVNGITADPHRCVQHECAPLMAWPALKPSATTKFLPCASGTAISLPTVCRLSSWTTPLALPLAAHRLRLLALALLERTVRLWALNGWMLHPAVGSSAESAHLERSSKPWKP